MLKNAQILGLQQKLSPQMIQQQLLLAVPTLALEQEIKLQLEANPVLEEVLEDDTEQSEQLTDTDFKDETKDSEDEDELSEFKDESYDIEDWYEYSRASDEEGYKSPEKFDREKQKEFESKTEYAINRKFRDRESPLEQLHRSGLDEIHIIIGEEILGSLGEDGYLHDSLDEIRIDIKKQSGLEVTNEEIEKVLKVIQRFDPLGLGARNLQECLTIQLEELKIDDKTRQLAIRIINELFPDFKARHYEKLSKQLGISLEEVNRIYEVIHKLNPIPGNTEFDTEKNYIYPDFIVTKAGGELRVELTDDFIPALRVNRRYFDMFKTKKTPKKTREFLKEKLDAAKWFINSIISRRETMLKVMKAIVKRQREFFITNGENLKPMYEKDIASDINMDLSTVSRTVRNKYVQTDSGVYELKYFFSNPIHTESGEDVSSKIIKQKIRELIDNEDKSKPLSDDRISLMLQDAGYQLARRTIAKYREAIKIPKASLRRQIIMK